jgi:Fungal specific transcription factor domain
LCIYDERPVQSQFTPHGYGASGQASSQPQQLAAFAHGSIGSVFVAPSSGVDPFQHESLWQATVDVTVGKEALKVFDSFSRVSGMAEAYFDSIHHRITIMSKKRFFDQLPTLFARPKADYIALCLCMHLIQQQPSALGDSMQSSIYVNVKSIMGMLTATAAHSLDIVQCWVLITMYEMGHALHPAASMSLAACAKLARSIGLHRRHTGLGEGEATGIEFEERKRVWWAVVNLER